MVNIFTEFFLELGWIEWALPSKVKEPWTSTLDENEFFISLESWRNYAFNWAWNFEKNALVFFLPVMQRTKIPTELKIVFEKKASSWREPLYKNGKPYAISVFQKKIDARETNECADQMILQQCVFRRQTNNNWLFENNCKH